MTLYAIDQSAGLIAVDQVTGVVSVSSSNVVQSVTTIRANEVFTVTVNQYSNISAASIGGHVCTNIIEVDATTFSCVAPRSANYFGDNDLIFTDSTGACPAFSVSVLPETGYAAVLIATPPVWAPELITGNQYIYQPTQSYAGETSTVTVNSDGTISTTSGIVEGFPVVGYKIDHLSNYLAGNEVTYTLGVNDAPILDSSIPDQNFDAGDNVSIDFNAFFSDSDINDEITVSLSVTPSGLTLNNGVLTGIAQSFSQANIIATATDKAGNTQSDTFSFAVASLGSDSTPDQFSLGDAIFNAQAGSAQERSVTVTGIDTDANISVSAGAEYRINSSAYTSAQGTVSNGDTVTVRVIARSFVGGQVSASLNIGGVTDNLSVFTFTDAQPDQFSLGADVLDAQPSSIVDRAFTISGLSGTDRALISSTNATFSLDGSPFVSGTVSVGNGVDVIFRIVASSLLGETVVAEANLNGVSDSVIVRVQPSVADSPVFTQDISDVSGVVGEITTIDVSSNFSFVSSYQAYISPGYGAAASFESEGAISISATESGKYRVVVVGANLAGHTVRSNVFIFDARAQLDELIVGEPIDACIEFEPAVSDGISRTLYGNNTNAIVIKSLMGQMSRQSIVSATATGEVLNESGASIHSLVFDSLNDGFFSLVNLSDFDGCTIKVRVLANSATAEWLIPVNASSRTH